MANRKEVVVVALAAFCLAAMLFSVIPNVDAQPPPSFYFSDDFNSGNFNQWTGTYGKPKIVKGYARFKASNNPCYCYEGVSSFFDTIIKGKFRITKSNTFFMALIGRPETSSSEAPERFLLVGITGNPPRWTILLKRNSNTWQAIAGDTAELNCWVEFELEYGFWGGFSIRHDGQQDTSGDDGVGRSLDQFSIGVLLPSQAKVYADDIWVHSWLE